MICPDANGRDLRIELPAEPSSVGEIRQRVREHAIGLDLSPQQVYDLTTIVSEACGNVVRYAYEDAPAGSLEVTVHAEDDELDVRIRDRGGGICPRQGGELQGAGLGLPLIGALSRAFCLRSELGVGTELGIRIPIRGSN